MTDIKDYICTAEFNITFVNNNNTPRCIIKINTPDKVRTFFHNKYELTPGVTLTVGPFEFLGRV